MAPMLSAIVGDDANAAAQNSEMPQEQTWQKPLFPSARCMVPAPWWLLVILPERNARWGDGAGARKRAQKSAL